MSATKILWKQIVIVFAIVLATMWAATQWVAWKLGYQPQLGHPWFELISGVPIYLPPSFFWWWYAYDAYAPQVFVEGAYHRGVWRIHFDRGCRCHVGVAGARSQDRRELRFSPLGDANGDSCRRPYRVRWCRARAVRARPCGSMDRSMCCASRRPGPVKGKRSRARNRPRTRPIKPPSPHVHRFRSPLQTVYETALQRKSPESFAPKASGRSAQQ
jgi:hypothetical protein